MDIFSGVSEEPPEDDDELKEEPPEDELEEEPPEDDDELIQSEKPAQVPELVGQHPFTQQREPHCVYVQPSPGSYH